MQCRPRWRPSGPRRNLLSLPMGGRGSVRSKWSYAPLHRRKAVLPEARIRARRSKIAQIAAHVHLFPLHATRRGSQSRARPRPPSPACLGATHLRRATRHAVRRPYLLATRLLFWRSMPVARAHHRPEARWLGGSQGISTLVTGRSLDGRGDATHGADNTLAASIGARHTHSETTARWMRSRVFHQSLSHSSGPRQCRLPRELRHGKDSAQWLAPR